MLESLSLLGPSVLFAAFTGVLLFASSLIAGGAENWFVLRNIDSVIRYNPRITRVLGTTRADRWARFLRKNISGLASNISLGFMLGLVPAFAAFFGLGLEVRHVTLSTGQIGVAIRRWAGRCCIPICCGGQLPCCPSTPHSTWASASTSPSAWHCAPTMSAAWIVRASTRPYVSASGAGH